MDYVLGGICLGLCGAIFVVRAIGGFNNESGTSGDN